MEETLELILQELKQLKDGQTKLDDRMGRMEGHISRMENRLSDVESQLGDVRSELNPQGKVVERLAVRSLMQESDILALKQAKQQ